MDRTIALTPKAKRLTKRQYLCRKIQSSYRSLQNHRSKTVEPQSGMTVRSVLHQMTNNNNGPSPKGRCLQSAKIKKPSIANLLFKNMGIVVAPLHLEACAVVSSSSSSSISERSGSSLFEFSLFEVTLLLPPDLTRRLFAPTMAVKGLFVGAAIWLVIFGL